MTSKTKNASKENPDFDRHISRWGTASSKWDLLTANLGHDAISLSVADMEFLTAPSVLAAVTHAAQHGIYGYTETFPDFFEAAVRWQNTQHNWCPSTTSALFFPRIIQCLSALLTHGFPAPEDDTLKVVSFSPAYGPLVEVSRQCGADVHLVALDSGSDGTHEINWEALNKALEGANLLLWCNPHNPTGRVWTFEELKKVADLALKHKVLVFSDDIHADFVRPGHAKYMPLAKVSPELWDKELLIQCTSPGKTFNTAGLESSVIFAPPHLHEKLKQAKRKSAIHNPSYFAVPATIAAWTMSDEWVVDLRKYIDKNMSYAVEYLRSHLPKATVSHPDGTYLIWVDARPYLRTKTIQEVEKISMVSVSAGESFGDAYRGFFRLNVALPTHDLSVALSRLCTALLGDPSNIQVRSHTAPELS